MDQLEVDVVNYEAFDLEFLEFGIGDGAAASGFFCCALVQPQRPKTSAIEVQPDSLI